MKNRIGALVMLALVLNGCKNASAPLTKEIESHSAGDVVISLANEKGELAQGQNSFVIAFRSASKNEPIDPGKVTVESSMAMPGMAPMTAPIEIESAGKTGQYIVKGEFGMSGAWRFEVRWEGPAGPGSTSFNSNVR
jgi:YtkA-like protein